MVNVRHTEDYPSGRMHYSGLYDKEKGVYEGECKEYYDTDITHIKFEGEMKNGVYHRGTFRSKSKSVSLYVHTFNENGVPEGGCDVTFHFGDQEYILNVDHEECADVDSPDFFDDLSENILGLSHDDMLRTISRFENDEEDHGKTIGKLFKNIYHAFLCSLVNDSDTVTDVAELKKELDRLKTEHENLLAYHSTEIGELRADVEALSNHTHTNTTTNLIQFFVFMMPFMYMLYMFTQQM